MMVGGQTSARVLAISDYHAPFDQSLKSTMNPSKMSIPQDGRNPELLAVYISPYQTVSWWSPHHGLQLRADTVLLKKKKKNVVKDRRITLCLLVLVLMNPLIGFTRSRGSRDICRTCLRSNQSKHSCFLQFLTNQK